MAAAPAAPHTTIPQQAPALLLTWQLGCPPCSATWTPAESCRNWLSHRATSHPSAASLPAPATTTSLSMAAGAVAELLKSAYRIAGALLSLEAVVAAERLSTLSSMTAAAAATAAACAASRNCHSRSALHPAVSCNILCPIQAVAVACTREALYLAQGVRDVCWRISFVLTMGCLPTYIS